MRVKLAHFGVSFRLAFLFFGALSNPILGHEGSALAYPGFNSPDSVTFSHSSRETPSTKKTSEFRGPSSPFAPGTHNVSLGVGQVFLLGNLGSNYANTIAPALEYTYGVSDLFAFTSNFSYHSHSSSTLSIWNLDAGLRANLAYFDQLVPFANIGLGFYSPSYTYSNSATANALLFGMQLGTGIDLLMSNTVFFGASANYHSMFESAVKDSQNVSRTLGGAFFTFMIHAGKTF